ncbi:hypothetical protein Tco_1505838 [Tanacetum coccineum]
MFIKTNCVHPTNAMHSWMLTRRSILIIRCIRMKAKSWQTSFRTIHSDSALLLLHQCHGSTWGQFWHTLQEDGSKYKLKFMLDRKDITMTLNDFRRIFHVPQATDNNHERFVATPKFSEMVPFFLNTLGFTLELRSPSKFKTTGLIQPWQTLGKIFARYYVELLWEGLHYALEHPSTQIPYPRFTKIIVGHYMTAFPEISRRARDKYHKLEDDAMLMDHYRMYDAVFGVDVPTTQSQPIESTQGTHRTTSTPRIPNPEIAEGELNTIQLSLAEQKSHEELEAKENEKKVKEHLMAEEIKKLVEGSENVENVEVDSSTLRQNAN